MLDVEQSFGNCPECDQLRDYEFVVKAQGRLDPIEQSGTLDDAAQNMIKTADGTSSPSRPIPRSMVGVMSMYPTSGGKAGVRSC